MVADARNSTNQICKRINASLVQIKNFDQQQFISKMALNVYSNTYEADPQVCKVGKEKRRLPQRGHFFLKQIFRRTVFEEKFCR